MPDPIFRDPQAPGTALPEADAGTSVFINCPYDTDYEPLRDALLFTVACCGFIPRSADESGKVSVSRMERILHAINTSDYSIHDLSRCRGEGQELLARFNMPLELGIAMARRYPGVEHQGHHDWLVLVPENAPYARFVSDLAGYDLKRYDGNVESLIQRVVAWLMTQPAALSGLRPTPVIEKLEAFRKEKARLKAEWNEIPWTKLVQAAFEQAPKF